MAPTPLNLIHGSILNIPGRRTGKVCKSFAEALEIPFVK